MTNKLRRQVHYEIDLTAVEEHHADLMKQATEMFDSMQAIDDTLDRQRGVLRSILLHTTEYNAEEYDHIAVRLDDIPRLLHRFLWFLDEYNVLINMAIYQPENFYEHEFPSILRALLDDLLVSGEDLQALDVQTVYDDFVASISTFNKSALPVLHELAKLTDQTDHLRSIEQDVAHVKSTARICNAPHCSNQLEPSQPPQAKYCLECRANGIPRKLANKAFHDRTKALQAQATQKGK